MNDVRVSFVNPHLMSSFTEELSGCALHLVLKVVPSRPFTTDATGSIRKVD